MKQLATISLVFFSVLNLLSGQHFKETIISPFTRMKAVKVIDFDEDGDLDIISSSPYGFLISENRAGKFFTRSLMPLMENTQPELYYFMNPNSGLGDFDGNGYLDFAFIKGAEIKIYFQTALYKFEPKIVYADAAGLRIEVHDIEGDGTADLILTSENRLVWLESKSDKSFSIYRETGDRRLFLLTHIDYDGDGYLDYITKWNGTLKVIKVDPETKTISWQPIYNYFFSAEFIMGDISGDGKADIVSFGRDLIIAIQGDNGWARRVYEVGDFSDTGYFIDYNRDGVKDLVTYDIINAEQFFYLSGDSIVKDFSIDFDLIGQGDYFDFDNNGEKELFIYPTGNRLTPMNNFREVEIMPTAPLNDFRKIVRFDIDNDGDGDILYANQNGVYLMNNLGDNHFETSFFTEINLNGEQCEWMTAADLDGDGDEDLITRIGKTNMVYRNEAGFTFKKDTLDFLHPESFQMKFFDMNQDGLIDLLPQGNGAKRGELVYYLNKGNLEFDSVKLELEQWYHLLSYEVLDFDKDGDFDFILNRGASITLLENKGQGNYTQVRLAGVFDANFPDGLIVNDFDYDGFYDLAVLNDKHSNYFSNDNRIQILFNQGDNRTFTKIPVPSLGNIFGALDINGDKLLDLVDLSGAGFTYHLADNFFQYRSTRSQIINPIPESYLIEDIDKDGDIDIVASSEELTLFENTKLTDNPFVEINIFLDDNRNGLKDTSEIYYSDPHIAIIHETEMYFGGKAKFSFPTFPFRFDIQHLDTTKWKYTTEFSITLGAPTDGYSQTLNIGITPNQPIYDLGFDMDYQATRCNEVTPFYLNIRNEGNQPIPLSEYSFEIDTAISFIEFFPKVDIVTDSIAYNSTGILKPGEVFNSTILLNLPNELRTGDNFTNYGKIDAFDASNMLIFQEIDTLDFTLTCAYDPNDKMVQPAYSDAGYILANQELKYTIRFQNTGNDTARNVRITDILSENLDPTTLKILNSSHPEVLTVYMEMEEADKLIFDFIGINLPDSTTNLMGSQGFVSFSCVPKQRFANPGKKIENTSNIYFDYNQPIVTNTVVSTITNCEKLNKLSWGNDHLDVENKGRRIILENPILDSVKWYENDELFSTETTPYLDFDTPGDKLIKVVSYSPICVFEDTHTYTVNGNTTSATDFLSKENFEIYPNPSTGNITLTGKVLADYSLLIYDVHKKLIHKEKQLSNYQTLQLSNSGMYFFTFLDEQGTQLPFVKRVIILGKR